MFKKRKKDPREKRIPRTYGGYPSGDRRVEEMPPPPPSWIAPPATNPASNQDAQDAPTSRL